MIISRQKLIGYIFILFLILNGGTIIKVLGIGAEFQLGTLFLFFTMIFLSGKLPYKKIVLSVFFFVPIFILISSIQFIKFNNLDGIFSNQIVNFITLIIIAVIVSIHFGKRKKDFPVILNNILKVFIIHAILSSLILTFFPSKTVLFTAINGDSVNPYVGYGYIFFQRMHLTYLDIIRSGTFEIFNFEVYRAHGIFWEPGVFSIYVNIFIFLNLFIFKKRANIILGIIAVFLSWSTTGMAVLLVQMSYYSIVSFKFNIRSLLQALGSLILITIVGWLSVINIDNKVYGDNSGSAAQRFMDTMSAIEIIKKNPMIGIGVDFELFNEQMIKAKPKIGGALANQLALDKVDENRFSNSLLRIFVYFGLPLGALLLFSFFKQNLIIKHKGLFTVINFIGVSASPILFLAFHFTFIVNGLMYQLSILKNESNLELKRLQEKKEILIN
jgi:O-antigen ligase/polysaccharide polymerase Wzy-like membrane protein